MMTAEQLYDLWEKCENERWESTERSEPELNFHKRPDINAFLLLDKLLPGTGDIVSCAEHDEIFLNVNLEELAKVIAEKEVVELIRCGVHFNSEINSLHMFV